jgi:hypothetical protein
MAKEIVLVNRENARKARNAFRMSLGANPETVNEIDWWCDATSLGPNGPFDSFTVSFTASDAVKIEMVKTKVCGHLRQVVANLEKISKEVGYTKIILDSRNDAVWTALGFTPYTEWSGNHMVKYL